MWEESPRLRKLSKERRESVKNDLVRHYSHKPGSRFPHSEQQKLAIKLYWEDRRGQMVGGAEHCSLSLISV